MDRSEGRKMSIAARASRDAAITATPVRAAPLDDILAYAALSAAKRALIRRDTLRALVCPGSEHSSIGWWGRSSWSERAADSDLGGPWSVEFVGALCARGLLGVHPDAPDVAKLTRAGRSWLKAAKAAANVVPDDTGSERSEHRDAQNNTSLHSEEKEETRD